MNYNMMPVAYAVIADPFAKSPYNPVNMSRTASKKSSGHAPSARILERVREAAADLAHLATTQQGWKFVTEKNRAMVYEMNGRALPPTVSTVHTFGAGGGHISDFYLVRAVTTVHANIPAVLDALQARTTEEFAPKMKKIFGKHYKQGVVVNELSCTTPPPFAPDPDSTSGARKSFSEDDAYSVNWLSLQSGSSDKSRDFTMVCYQDGFERQDRTLTRIGRGAVHDRTLKTNSSSLGASQGPGANATVAPKLLGVHVFSSVNFKDIPALPSNQHSDRQHFRNSGFVVEATNDPHAFKLSLFLSLLPTKSSLKHARKYQKWLLSLVSIVGNVASAVQIVAPELNLSHLGKTAWKKSDHCYICLKMFRTFRRCHHCRLCGEAVCSTCSGFVKVSMGRGRSNSQSSVDMRSGYSYDDAGSSSGDDSSSSSYQNETRGCTVCIQSISQNGSVVGHKSSRSSSSFSSNSQAVVNSSSAMSVSARSEDESSISFGDDNSDFGGSASHGGQNSFQQSYYDHRKRSTNSSNDDNQPSSAATNPLAASSSSVNMKQHQFNNSDYHHNMMNTPSMSTTSSSFSRTSHEAELMMIQQYPALQSSSNQDQYAPQHQPRNYMQSFSSEVSYGNDDLSLDPDILALAGLTLKPTVSSHSSNSSGSNHAYAQQQQVLTVAEEDYDDFDPAASQCSASGGPRRWSATDSVASSNNSAAAVPMRAPPARPQQPQEGSSGSTFHFSVMSNSSNSNSNNTSSLLPVPTKSSVHAEIAALMLEDLATTSSSVSSQVGGPYGKPPTSSSSSLSASMRLPASAPPQQQTQADARFHMSATSHSSFGANGNAAMGMSRGFNPSASAGSSSNHNPQFSSSKIISMATLTASQQQQQRSLSTASSNERANDMILLSAPAPKSPEFVCFEESQRESIFVRPGDGSDMIPLNLAGGRF